VKHYWPYTFASFLRWKNHAGLASACWPWMANEHRADPKHEYIPVSNKHTRVIMLMRLPRTSTAGTSPDPYSVKQFLPMPRVLGKFLQL